MTTDQPIHDQSRITALVSSGHRVLTDCDAAVSGIRRRSGVVGG
jgi:hypothetical protein